MSAELYQLSFSGSMLVRGFWLYVWEVTTKSGKTVLYVGMTGDSSSLNAQSPFNRLGQHLGSNKHSNALQRHLTKAKISPELCKSFNLVTYGPIFAEASTEPGHCYLRAKVSALEKALGDALNDSGYAVLNTVNCRQELDQYLWITTKKAFAQRFPKLNSCVSRNKL